MNMSIEINKLEIIKNRIFVSFKQNGKIGETLNIGKHENRELALVVEILHKKLRDVEDWIIDSKQEVEAIDKLDCREVSPMAKSRRIRESEMNSYCKIVKIFND